MSIFDHHGAMSRLKVSYGLGVDSGTAPSAFILERKLIKVLGIRDALAQYDSKAIPMDREHHKLLHRALERVHKLTLNQLKQALKDVEMEGSEKCMQQLAA